MYVATTKAPSGTAAEIAKMKVYADGGKEY
jgi:hypothetical protein